MWIADLMKEEAQQMALIASEGSSAEFTPASQGAHPAVCIHVIDLGTQAPPPQSQYQSGPQRKVLIRWELGDEQTDDGRPAIVTCRYTLSLHEKASLRKVLESWRGRRFTAEELAGFDTSKLLGVGCIVAVVHSDDGKYARVASVSPLMRGMVAPKPAGVTILYETAMKRGGTWSELSERVRQTILASAEAAAWGAPEDTAPDHDDPHPADFDDDDDIPF